MPSLRRALRGLGMAIWTAALPVALPAALPAAALAQAAIDPSVAPRAAALERSGERALAIDLLGRYLAVAPDDGQAWFQLGSFYLADARTWHQRGHSSEPPGPLYLDFASTALEQAARLRIDSAPVLRGIVAAERAVVFVEELGWSRARAAWLAERPAPLPPYVVELGMNLAGSCPQSGVLLTGGDLENTAVWYATLAIGHRADLLPLRPDLYATDAVYRGRMARTLGVDSALSVQQALASVRGRRAICLTPGADSAALPAAQWTPIRLVLVSRSATPPGDNVLSVADLLKALKDEEEHWARDVRDVYMSAARRNPVLCDGVIRGLGERCGK